MWFNSPTPSAASWVLLSAGIFLWPQRQVVISQTQEPCLFDSTFFLSTDWFRGPHYNKVFENCVYSIPHWSLHIIEPTLLRVCLHYSIKAALDPAKVNCWIQWSIFNLLLLDPLKALILSPANTYFMPSKNSPLLLHPLILFSLFCWFLQFLFVCFKDFLNAYCLSLTLLSTPLTV